MVDEDNKRRLMSNNLVVQVSGFATRNITEKYCVTPMINKLGNLVSFKNPMNEKLFLLDLFEFISEIEYSTKIVLSLIQNIPINDYPYNISLFSPCWCCRLQAAGTGANVNL